MDTESREMDLPLSANFHEVRVQHFVLDLSCDLESKIFEGIITLFCCVSISRPADERQSIQENSGKVEEMQKSEGASDKQEVCPEYKSVNHSVTVCLDCHALDISACGFHIMTQDHLSLIESDQKCITNSLQIPDSVVAGYLSIFNSVQHEQFLPLDFMVHKHSLKVWLPESVDCKCQFILKVHYRTQPEGPSLMWTMDQNGRPCVFTIGHLQNNRSLFPSQDLPQAMSTWHCSVTLKDPHAEASVLMTGESEPEITFSGKGEKVFKFHSSYPMPAATFALAVGSWSAAELIATPLLDRGMPHCHLYSPPCLHEQGVDQLGRYLPRCFEVLNSILGPFPLKRLDILIVPECFDSLGMACPHLMFLSQSLLCPDQSMFARLSHELCHTWFGVLTGPRDWSEEWLTEGVCTYLEDMIHAAVMKWDDKEDHERLELRSLLKFRLLKSELDYTPEDLQKLRPHEGRPDDPEESKGPQLFVKNGLNPEKTLMQVHYLKGFFLLKYLEDIAGKREFLDMLRRFTCEHLGMLFSSKELLDYIFDQCPHLSSAGLTVSQVSHDWLDTPGMPEHLQNFPSAQECSLAKEVIEEVSYIKAAASKKRARGQRSRTQGHEADVLKARKLLPEQLVLLLEMLVEEDVAITSRQLRALRDIHSIETANAEIQHSWCELVIHRKAMQWVSDVEHFLLRHQALGVYLYGELMISGNRRLQDLAHKCYKRVETYMPEGPKTTVQAMLFPT